MPRTLRNISAVIIVHICSLTALAQQAVPWAANLDQARAEAARQNKIVLVHFWNKSCGPCLKLDRYVFNNPSVGRAVAEGCVPVKVNTLENSALATQFAIRTVPQDVFITPDGKEIWRGTSPQHDQAYIQMVQRVVSTAGIAARNPNQQLAQLSRGQRAFEGQATGYPPQGGFVPQNNNVGAGQPANATPSNAQPGGGEFSPANAQKNRSQLIVNQQFGQGNPPPVNRDPRQPPNGTPNFKSQPPAPSGAFAANRPVGNAPAGPGNPNGPSRPPAPGNGFQPGFNAPSNAGASNQRPPVGADPRMAQQPAPPRPAANAHPLAMDGYCPVTLVTVKDPKKAWSKGDARWGAHHRGRTYLFSGPEQQKQFLANPDHFAPGLSCYDPVLFAQRNQLVEGKREHGLTFHGQVFLFADEATLQTFSSDPDRYVHAVRQAMFNDANGQQRR